MNTEFVILAQGTQKRMGHAAPPKQLLNLPACGVPILARTVRQVWEVSGWWPTIVTWPHVRVNVEITPENVPSTSLYPAYVELESPGNSSLKGIARFLELREQHWNRLQPARTVVLLGDVVYSWACLDALTGLTLPGCPGWGFVGTGDLNNSGGELWGVAWTKQHHSDMMARLADALLRHPPFEDEYQPGQMRRWISGFRRGELRDHVADLIRSRHYVAIDDYTDDIDTPGDISGLLALSEHAWQDDANHGVVWPTPD